MKFKLTFSCILDKYHNKFIIISNSPAYRLSYTGDGRYTVYGSDNSIVSDNVKFEYINEKLREERSWKIFDKNPIESD